MKFTAFFLFAFSFLATAKGTAQSVTLYEKNAPIEKVFSEIKRQTGYSFFFNETLIKKANPVTIEVRNVDVLRVLDLCFKNQPLGYSIVGNTIVVEEKNIGAAAIEVVTPLPPPTITVTGRILNENGEPVAGASIQLKGDKTKGTSTDANGYFELKEVDEKAILIISGINIETREVKVNGKTALGDIVAKIRIDDEEDVKIEVNTGYQSLPKERATGSFVFMNQEQIESRTGGNIMDRLVGNIPSLQRDTRAGSNQNFLFNIRGINTFSTGAQGPLIVVDNFPYAGNIDLLNPNDIESVTILKDAAAASIWGARAGNGVIIITTKKAKLKGQKPSVSFNANLAISEKPDLYYNNDGMTVSEFIDNEIFLFGQGFYNSDLSGLAARQKVISPVVDLLDRHKRGLIDDAILNKEIDALRNNDYRKEYEKYFLQTPIRQNYTLSVTGGTDKINYILSGGYQQSISSGINANDAKRYNLRSLINIKPTSNFNISAGFMYNKNEQTLGGVRYPINPGGGKTGLYPYARLVGDNGEALAIPYAYNNRFIDTVNKTLLLDWTYKPLDEIDGTISQNNLNNLMVDLQAGYKINKAVSAEIRYSYQHNQSNGETLNRLESFFARDLINKYSQINGTIVNRAIPLGAIISSSTNESNVHNVRGRINYSQVFSGVHELNAFVGSDVMKSVATSNSFRNYGYDEESKTFSYVDYVSRHPVYGNLSGNVTIPRYGSYSLTNGRMVSFYANASYSYLQKHSLSFSARRDASNALGVKTNELWKPLWSVGYAWDITKETFFDIAAINSLKLRATYGHSGNIVAGNGYYPTISIQNGGSISLTGLPYALITLYPDPNRKWEDVRMINIGLDFSILNRRLSGSLEYFNKKSTDLIAEDAVDPTTSQNSVSKNVGILKGRGFDIILNSNNLTGALKWTTNFSLSYVKDVVKHYTGSISSARTILESGNEHGAPIVEGYPFNNVFSYHSAGLDPANGDPRGYDKDGQVSKDYINLLNPSLEALNYHGVSLPPYHGFLRNNFQYKNLNLSFNMVFKFGAYFKENGIDFITDWGLPNETYLRRWQKTGDELKTYVPSVVYPSQSNRMIFAQGTSGFVHKADFVRLQDIRLAYNFNISRGNQPFSIQLYGTASQPGFIWRANSIGRDPDNINTRALRGYSVGININL